MTTFTFDDVRLSWEIGAAYQPDGLAELVDDARLASIAPPRLTKRQRYEREMAQMARWADQIADQIVAEQCFGAPPGPWRCT